MPPIQTLLLALLAPLALVVGVVVTSPATALSSSPFVKFPRSFHSGFLDAGVKEGKRLRHHYVLIESEDRPAADPVLVWSNGGPGASSLFGLFTELGPYLMDPRKPMAFVRNEWGWSRRANLLVINGPPPVGFSYCDPPGPAGDFKSCGAWNDSSTAHHNFLALADFFNNKHPEYRSRDWFFSGESYAGVYIPMLVDELSRGLPEMKIRGVLMGNACMGTNVLCFSPTDVFWQVVKLRGSAQISHRTYASFMKSCEREFRAALLSATPERSPNITSKCAKMGSDAVKEAGYFDEYSLYDSCHEREEAERNPGCNVEAHFNEWIQSPEAKRALNISSSATFHTGDNGVGFDYRLTQKDLRPLYAKWQARSSSAKDKIRVVIYSGDADVSVNVFASEFWTSALMASREVKTSVKWQSWVVDDGRVTRKTATTGYVTRYEGDFDFVTFRGAPHFVPEIKRRASWEMVDRFMRRKGLTLARDLVVVDVDDDDDGIVMAVQ